MFVVVIQFLNGGMVERSFVSLNEAVLLADLIEANGSYFGRLARVARVYAKGV